MAQLSKLLHVQLLFTSVYHPQSNGLVERFNGVLQEMLHTMQREYGSQWVQHLQASVSAFNTSVSEATGYSPYYLLFGRHPVTIGDLLAINDEDADPPIRLESYVQQQVGRLRDAHAFVRKLMEDRLESTRETREQQRLLLFRPGDYVWLADPLVGKRLQHQAAHPSRYSGPYTVIKRLADGASYELEPANKKVRVPTAEPRTGSQRRIIANIDRLRSYHGDPPSDTSLPPLVPATAPLRVPNPRAPSSGLVAVDGEPLPVSAVPSPADDADDAMEIDVADDTAAVPAATVRRRCLVAARRFLPLSGGG